MADWVVCASCQLKHQARPDGACPRCKNPVGVPSAYAPPTTEATPEPEPLAPGTVSFGAKIAGALMLFNGVLVLIEGVQGGGNVSPVSTIFDFLIGGSLLANKDKYLVWAKVRVGLGLLVFGGMLLSQGDVAGFVVQAIFSTALLLLLLGQPGKARTALGAALAGVVVLLVIFGSLVDATGSNPLAGLAYQGQTEEVPGGVVRGQLRPYELSLPNADWRLRKEEAAKKDNALSDRWVIKPGADAHVMVIVEELEAGTTLDFGAYQQAVTQNLRSASKDFRVIDERPALNGLVMHTQSKVDGMEIDHVIRLYVDSGVAVQIMGFVPTNGFSAQEPELRTIVESFHL